MQTVSDVAPTRSSASVTSQPVISRMARRTALGIARLGADARADGRGAHVDRQELLRRMVEVVDLAPQDARKTVERLPEGHGYGVLQLRAPHLEHAGELVALRPKAAISASRCPGAVRGAWRKAPRWMAEG